MLTNPDYTREKVLMIFNIHNELTHSYPNQKLKWVLYSYQMDGQECLYHIPEHANYSPARIKLFCHAIFGQFLKIKN